MPGHVHRRLVPASVRVRSFLFGGASGRLLDRRRRVDGAPGESEQPYRELPGSTTNVVSRVSSESGRAEELFRGLLESAPDAIVILGADGAIAIVNVQTEQLFGYAREQLIGRRSRC